VCASVCVCVCVCVFVCKCVILRTPVIMPETFQSIMTVYHKFVVGTSCAI